MKIANPSFDPNCRACPRLAGFLDEVKLARPAYFCRPVPPFGVAHPRLIIVGLAPGMHGANRTGRPFTGDYAGTLLYATLHKFGFATEANPLDAANAPNPLLKLIDCRISNAVKCLPPENKPLPIEVKTCNRFLQAELGELGATKVILALGLVAHSATLTALGLKKSNFVFGHASRHALPDGRTLIDSYHCSRYNTQTKRLTQASFEAVFMKIRDELA